MGKGKIVVHVQPGRMGIEKKAQVIDYNPKLGQYPFRKGKLFIGIIC